MPSRPTEPSAADARRGGSPAGVRERAARVAASAHLRSLLQAHTVLRSSHHPVAPADPTGATDVGDSS